MRFTFYKDDIIHMELEEVMGDVFYHISISKWSRSTYTQCINLYLDSIEWCKERGYTTTYVLLSGDFVKTMKFAMMFGWENLVYCEQNNILLMYQEI